MKKLTVLVIAFFTLIGGVLAQDYTTLINQAENLFYQGKFAEAAGSYEKAFASGRASDIHLYSAACAWSQAGNPEKAMQKLRQAVDRGWMAIDPLLKDPDLAAVRSTPAFNELVGDLRERIASIEAGYDRKLVAQLEKIEERDQRHRRDIRALRAEGGDARQVGELELLQAELDAMNIAEIHPIVEQYGYPGKALVGNKCEVVFMVIQNADLETQKHYLPLLEEAAGRDDIPWFSYMRMVERIDTQEGRLQLYGTNVDRRDWDKQIDVLSGAESRRDVAAGSPRGHQSRWDVEPPVPAVQNR
jgi:tetratricopeptide (TPR) repeat protein